MKVVMCSSTLLLISIIFFVSSNLDSTAEKTNIPWRDMTKEILDSDVYKEKDAIEDTSIVYPDCNLLHFNECFCFFWYDDIYK